MFRSAASSYGRRVVGVVLTGLLDDGMAGLWQIHKHGGITIVQDPAEATKWYRKAAMQGHAGAQNNLGSSYEYAQGNPSDRAEALAWYILAAANGSEEAAENRDSLAQELSQKELAESNKRLDELRIITKAKATGIAR